MDYGGTLDLKKKTFFNYKCASCWTHSFLGLLCKSTRKRYVNVFLKNIFLKKILNWGPQFVISRAFTAVGTCNSAQFLE